jgi:chorismate dehydratase
MIKVSAVSYHNTTPMIYGLQQSGFINQMDLQLDIPAVTALKFMNDEVDVALIPVGVLPQLKNYNIITDICIGAIQQVKTVAVFAEQKIETLDKIYLDYHSRTSVELLKILLNEYWHLPNIQLIPASQQFEKSIHQSSAALMIGDKTFPLLNKIPFQYDLARAWHQLTNLPFAFAVWVAKPHVPKVWADELNGALQFGINNRNELIKNLKQKDATIDWHDYYFNCISYELDDLKKQGMNLFLDKIKKA